VADKEKSQEGNQESDADADQCCRETVCFEKFGYVFRKIHVHDFHGEILERNENEKNAPMTAKLREVFFWTALLKTNLFKIHSGSIPATRQINELSHIGQPIILGINMIQ